MSLLTVPEVADRLRVCTRTVRRLVAAGELEHARVGRLIRITERAVDRYVSSRVGA